MPRPYSIPLWKSSPFVRLLLPFALGITAQWYYPLNFLISVICLTALLLCLILFRSLPTAYRYRLQGIQGSVLIFLIFFAGVLFTYHRDIRNNNSWFGKYYTDSSTLVIRLTEPPIPKEKTFKVEAALECIVVDGARRRVVGKVLLYFSKEDVGYLPGYGDRILLTGNLRRIKNSGNPGAFDYERYAGFQQIFHQSFLKKDKYVLLNEHEENTLYKFIFRARSAVIKTLQENIRGDKKVTGIAEALLIGYKEDLDKNVVQDYSNAGVVHIIAISGMHLGLIYVVLIWLFARMPIVKRQTVLRVLLILSCLWIFSLMTGASASVLRSAVMFTCIVIGKNFFKQANIYNSLAASAFLLLCYNPYLLWDVGFQLSYLAVTGIVWLQKPLMNFWYVKNNFLRKVWEMSSITIAAQIITFPICLFYFHQFPNIFLLSNLICVPLSTVILFSEIFLLAFSRSAFIAALAGKLVYVLTWLMNTIIAGCGKIPFALMEGIYATSLTTWILYLLVFCICGALIYRNRMQMKMAVFSFGCLAMLWTYGKFELYRQRKIIIYNVSGHTAVDFTGRGKYWQYADDAMRQEENLRNYHLKPARISAQLSLSEDTLPAISRFGNIWRYGSKKMMVIDSTASFEPSAQKLNVDIVLICGNPTLKMAGIVSAVTPAVIVFDASNSLWKIGQWKKECSALHLRCHNAAEDGAFISDAN